MQNKFNDFNCLIRTDPMISYEESDKSILFGEDEDLHEFQNGSVDFLDLLVFGKFFSSKSNAMKAGWYREIPPLYSMYKIGKMKRVLCIYNSSEIKIDKSSKNNYKNLLKSI